MVIALAYISYFKSLFLHELNRVFYLNVLVKYDIVNIVIDESESRSNKKKSICPRRNIQTYIGFFLELPYLQTNYFAVENCSGSWRNNNYSYIQNQ